MKSTLVAVALVLAILYGLKAFTRAVARPIERDPVTCAKAQDSTYLMPYAMKLLNGGSIEEVAAEEYNDLRKILISIGVSTAQLPTKFDPKWIKWEA